MDVCAAYVRPLGGWLPVAKLVLLMAQLGVDEQATRSAISRMSRRGLLVQIERDGTRGYGLSEESMQRLHDSDLRIHSNRRPARLDEGWLLILISIPEDERGKRHVLRTHLEWLGCGNLGNGVWLAPHRLAESLRRDLVRMGMTQYVTAFGSEFEGMGKLDELVHRAWDLDLLREMYTDFLSACKPIQSRWSHGRTPRGADAFVDYTLTLYRWRKFPYLDPGLPEEVMPARWVGRRAAEMFFSLRSALYRPALEYASTLAELPVVAPLD